MKKKQPYEDDGHTVYSMENVPNAFGKTKDKREPLGLTRKERFAAIRAGLAVFLPRFLLVLGCFTVVALLLYLWLA